jgi:hypothetical protein
MRPRGGGIVPGPGLILPDRDRDVEIARRTLSERDDLRRKALWLVVVFAVVSLVSLSGLAGCDDGEPGDVVEAQHITLHRRA